MHRLFESSPHPSTPRCVYRYTQKKQLTHQLLQFFVTFLGRRAKEKKTRQNNEYELTIITIGNHHHKLGTGGRSHHGVVVRGGDLFSCSLCG